MKNCEIYCPIPSLPSILVNMSFAELSRGRGLRLGGAIAIAVVVVLVVAWLVVHFSTASNKANAQEELIRQTVSDSGVAADYNILKVTDGDSGYTLNVSLKKDAPSDATGELLHTLYGDLDSVSRVNLTFTETQSLSTSKLERSTQQWTALVGHVESAGPVTATFSQVGPTGAATYWLDMTSYAADPAAEYERLQKLDRPGWLTHGNLQLTTSPDSWPALLINAGRDITPEELNTFRSLNRELAATVNKGEHYELKMHVALGAESAEFEMRIITEPLNHSAETPAPGSTGNTEETPGELGHQQDTNTEPNPENAEPNPENRNETTAPNEVQDGGTNNSDAPTTTAPPAPTNEPSTEPTEEPAPNSPSITVPDTETDNGTVPPFSVGPKETTEGVSPADPSARIETISTTLSTRSELILVENGLSAFLLTIQIDDREPLHIKS